MAIDINKIKSRLGALSSSNNKTDTLWKPSPGKEVIRIVPSTFNEENPFTEFLFHYGVNNKTYLSPSSFGRPDPIVEYSNTLKKSGDKEMWKQGRKLEPKMRTYARIIVRGKEKEGVKFWGFGKQVYQDLLSIIADEDYGDITDLKTGRDITVEFTEAAGEGTYPTTSIRVKPTQTPATTDKEIADKIKNQKDILELFPELSYDELYKVMDAWLNPESASDEPPSVESASVAKAKSNELSISKTTDQVVDEFDDIFEKE